MKTRKIVEYDIVYQKRVQELVDIVNTAIKEDGFEPLGSLVHDAREDYLMQPIVKYEEEQ